MKPRSGDIISNINVRELLDSSIDGFLMADLSGQVVEVNEAYCRLVGYSRNELLTMHISMLDAVDNKEGVEARIDSIMRNGSLRFESKHRHRNGSIIDIEACTNYTPHNGGCIVSFIRDITERKQVVEALRENKDLLTEIMELGPISMAIVRMDGTIEYINRRAIETFGYFPEDIPDMGRWWALAYPDASYREEVITQWMGLVEKALAEKGDIERREYRVTCKDGTVKTTLIFGIPVSDRIFVMFDDISERKKWEESLKDSEFFFKESQRAASIGSYKAEFMTGSWQSSEVLDQIFGIDQGYARTIEGWEEIIHPDDREEMDRYLRQEVLSKHNPFNREYRIVRKSDGELRWVLGLGEVGFDSTGNVTFLIGTIQDITERKMANETLRMNEERIQSLLKLYQIKFTTEQEIVGFALEEVVRLTRSTGGYLHFFNEDEQTIQLFSWSEEVMKTCSADQDQHYPLDSAGIWADSARLREPVLHNDYQAIADKKGYPDGHFHLTRHLGIPIFDGERIVGVMGVGNKELPYNESDVLQVTLYMSSMWSILHQKRMDIERGRMEEQLLRAATYDSLTGIFNRQALEKILLSEMERAKRYDTSFSLIMIDIDDFKRINDTLGHQAGDRVLTRVAEILRQNVRIVDSVGRWGGEEFIIQLPETKEKEAAKVAEKLRDVIAHQRIYELVITASFGVSSYRKDDTLDTIIKRADDLLYSAKGRGKNRVETCPIVETKP